MWHQEHQVWVHRWKRPPIVLREFSCCIFLYVSIFSDATILWSQHFLMTICSISPCSVATILWLHYLLIPLFSNSLFCDLTIFWYHYFLIPLFCDSKIFWFFEIIYMYNNNILQYSSRQGAIFNYNPYALFVMNWSFWLSTLEW